MAKDFATRAENYSQWYQDLVIKADLAENSAVRGCMVIKPYGFAIWEKMQAALDKMFKDTGHSNAYFPLLIPKSFFSKEASHIKGFAKECAIVTHYRLKNDEESGGIVVDPEARLEEELIIRPTSETIIWHTYRGWIQSYRDLPILVNQWANVVRWEMRTRLFLRTAEFLWQEGHTAHATREEAEAETRQMLDVYATFAEKFMAMPVIKGVKTPNERFAGALDTYCIEALMQDGKALQAGTSHFLGQNFAKAFDVQFANKEGKLDYVWATSWGVSTRLMGALVMAHSDDDGLVLPPLLAPIQVVIVPIYKNEEERARVAQQAEKIRELLVKRGISVKFDNRDTHKPGWKFAEYELKGVPVRIAIGPRDLENGTAEVARRDTREKLTFQITDLDLKVEHLLENIQANLYTKAVDFREDMTTKVDSWDQFMDVLETKGGFVMAHWDGTDATEEAIKAKSKATIRCIPLNGNAEPGNCVLSGKPSDRRVVFARAYYPNMEFKPPKEIIRQLLTEKAVMKQDVYENSLRVFDQVKRALADFETEYKSLMSKVDKRIKISFKETSEFQAELSVAGDKLVFVMHTNVFTFDRDHTMWKTSYVQQTPENSYCGMFSMYNFLADSFKYNRLNDIGYLIGRLFVNRENHFFVEGKRQLGFLYNDFGHATLDEATVRSIICSAVIYSIDFDLFTPNYEDVKQVSVEEIKAANLNESIMTGKRLGFRFQADSDSPEL